MNDRAFTNTERDSTAIGFREPRTIRASAGVRARVGRTVGDETFAGKTVGIVRRRRRSTIEREERRAFPVSFVQSAHAEIVTGASVVFSTTT